MHIELSLSAHHIADRSLKLKAVKGLLSDEGHHQVILVSKIVIESTGGNIGLFYDLAYRDRVRADLLYELNGRFQDCVFDLAACIVFSGSAYLFHGLLQK